MGMIGGKRALIAGYGDVGKGCAFAMRGAGARVLVTECDPICALQACMEGFQVVTMEQSVAEADIFVSSTGNFDNEIDMAGLEGLPGMKVENIKSQVDRFVFPDGHGVIVMSCSFTNQTLAQLDLLKNWKETKAYGNDVYL